MTSHVPGPWVVCVNSLDGQISIEQDRQAMDPADGEPVIVVMCVDDRGMGLNREIAMANAHLMAASPLLCKASKALVDTVEATGGLEGDGVAADPAWFDLAEAYRQAKHAIDLAEPKQQEATRLRKAYSQLLAVCLRLEDILDCECGDIYDTDNGEECPLCELQRAIQLGEALNEDR